ncbi:MAG: hypothetical protein ACAI25_04065, partial [Planctomycetota bacterium]
MGAILGAAALVPVAYAQEKVEPEKNLQKALDTIGDDNAATPDRVRAITLAGNMTNLTSDEKIAGKKEAYRKALDAALRALGSKQPRTEDQEKVATAGFGAIGSFFGKGFPELAKVAKPFLQKPARVETRLKALSAIEKAGG